MKRTSSSWLSALAAALMIGTLGFSTFVSAVSTQEATEPSDKTNAIDAEQGAAPAEVAPADVIQPRDNPAPAAAEPAPVPQDVDGKPAFGVRLSSDGLLPGRFTYVDPNGNQVAAQHMTVTFKQNRKVIARVRPGVQGVFQASGISPGVYSVVANGPDGFYASSILVLPPANGHRGPADVGLQIDTALVAPENVSLVQFMIRERFFPSRAGDSSPAFDGLPLDRTARPSTPLRTPQLVIGLDGHLRGRLNQIDRITEQRVPASGCTIWLIRGKEVRATADTDAEGVFDIDATRWNLDPNHYSLLVTGRPQGSSGFAALGVEVVHSPVQPNPNADARPESPFRLVSAARFAADGDINGVDIGNLVPFSDIETDDIEDQTEEEEVTDATGGGGGSGGGGSGGGGAGGGAGWLSALGALGALGVLGGGDEVIISPAGP